MNTKAAELSTEEIDLLVEELLEKMYSIAPGDSLEARELRQYLVAGIARGLSTTPVIYQKPI